MKPHGSPNVPRLPSGGCGDKELHGRGMPQLQGRSECGQGLIRHPVNGLSVPNGAQGHYSPVDMAEKVAGEARALSGTDDI